MTNINPTPHLFMRMDAHHRVMISLVVARYCFPLTYSTVSLPSTILVTWMSFALSAIVLIWITILSSHPREVRRIAKLQDSSRAMLFGFVITASVVSLAGCLFPAQIGKRLMARMSAGIFYWPWQRFLYPGGWCIPYLPCGMHICIMIPIADDGTPKKGGGLQFPDETQPDYLDFVYFSFVIGMTFQVSDVEISSKHIRRLAWLHGLISFIFNTAIVALSINVISGLVSS